MGGFNLPGDCHLTNMAKSQCFIKKFLRRKCGSEGTAATGDVSRLEYAEKAPGSRTVGGKERGEEE